MSIELDRINQAQAGGYRSQRACGRNGFIVYLAHDLKYDRDVVLWMTQPEPAVKVIASGPTTSPAPRKPRAQVSRPLGLR